ncbi:MAG: hypothetical protein EP330_01615 [Deltaproteobacteria bacterium]|nr:MAG: hypothetical protein EP330_01615 [Deltaproteobacteria bacterium]
MTDWRELVSYVGFTDEDRDLLTAFWPIAEPHIPDVVDDFYARVMRHPGTRRIIRDDAQMARLRRSMAHWLEETLRGPHDEAYFQRRLRVGHRHVEVGLPPRYVSTAMAVIVERMSAIAFAERPEQAFAISEAVHRITTVDAAVMTASYMEQHELEQLRSLQDLLISRLPVTVLLVDRDDRVISATRPSYRLFEGARLLGARWQEALPPALVEASELDEAVHRARNGNRDICLLRVDTVIDGVERQFRIDVVFLAHEEADILLHIEELTDAIELEGRVQRSEALAKLGELSAAVAHELRNPLAGISGAVQVLSGSMDADDRRKKIMDKVQGQILRLNRLVTELLAFARPVEAQVGSLDLRALAERVAELLPGEVEVRGEGRGVADPHLVEQILLNLGANGLAAGTCCSFIIEEGAVLVEDDGPGVDPKVRDRIFEPFVTTKTQGTGLGLAISRKAAQAMDGDLVLADEPRGGSGACFRLTLPRP